MLGIKPAHNGMHDGPPHKVRLAPYPEPLAVDVESPRLPLVKPESKGGRSLYLLFSEWSAFQSRYKFYTKIAPRPRYLQPGETVIY